MSLFRQAITYHQFIIQLNNLVLDVMNKRAMTRSVSKTDLHPLDRHDEGMKGHRVMTRWDMGGKASKGSVENACSICNNMGFTTDPLFQSALILSKRSYLFRLCKATYTIWFEILRISEYSWALSIKLREFIKGTWTTKVLDNHQFTLVSMTILSWDAWN